MRLILLGVLTLLFAAVNVLVFSGCGPPNTSIGPGTGGQYALTTSTQGQGSVEPSEGTYDEGSEVTLTATAAADWAFSKWQGDATGADNPTQITMDADKNVTAVFVEQPTIDQYVLAVSVQGQGSVDPSSGTYDEGSEVTLTATAAADWAFSKWQGDASGTDATIKVTMDKAKNITGVFINMKPRVLLKTTKGEIVLELDRAKAPITVANFLQYVEEGFYDGTDNKGATIFHRVISNFMIQTGGLTAEMTAKETHDEIQIESSNGLKNERGTIAMARTDDPNSATSQFFINLVDNGFLDYVDESNLGYTVFGKVLTGMGIVDTIGAVETTTKAPYSDMPVDTITITSATVVTDG